MLKKLFTEHPHSIGESYFEHMKFASIFGFNLLIGSLSCFLHAFLPFICKNTGSNYMFKMVYFFINRMPATDPRIIQLTQALAKKSTTPN